MKRSKFSSEDSDNSSESSSLTSSSDEEVDAKDLKLIKEYIPNRKELAAQLFKSVKQEKIRMMLPQILKKVELDELEELCASELIGMSKSRIISVINGQEMLQSSNTEDSDNSGPSLEIISDAEWLSGEETNIKVEVNSKNKNTKKLNKKQDSKAKLKGKSKLLKDGKSNPKVKLEKVKTETKEKEKEGESLLDLLELEMRARAIRALIRKEDSSSTNAKNTEASNSTNVTSLSGNIDKNSIARQANLKEQLEKIDVLMQHGDDEDVFVVIHPAPTIELLSSESDTEDHSKRINQKLVNERNSVNEKEAKQSNKNKHEEVCIEQKINKDKNTSNDKNISNEKNKVEKCNKNGIENNKSNLPISVTENNENDNAENSNQLSKETDLEEGEIIDNEDVKTNETVNDSASQRKIKKIKKNPHIRTKKNDKESSNNRSKLSELEVLRKEISYSESDKSNSAKVDSSDILNDAIEIEESPVRKNDTENILITNESTVDNITKIDLLDDKALDIEEIINLDDYPDDMDDLESNKEIKDVNKEREQLNTNETNKTNAVPCSETWATRYYQQDEVQNVIKESKIQSEIRKRLRERQRQSKMNNCPQVKDQNILESSSESIIKPTGSVEEYLALKTSNQIENQVSADVLTLSNENIIAEKINQFEKNEVIDDNNMPSSISDTEFQNSIVIVKKAKLIENVVAVTKIELPTDESVESDTLRTDNSKIFVTQKNSILNDLKNTELIEESSSKDKENIVIQSNINSPKEDIFSTVDEKARKCKDNSSTNKIKIDREITEGFRESNKHIDLSGLPNTSSLIDNKINIQSDSREDDIKISNKNTSEKSTENYFSKQMEQTTQSDKKSELRPD